MIKLNDDPYYILGFKTSIRRLLCLLEFKICAKPTTIYNIHFRAVYRFCAKNRNNKTGFYQKIDITLAGPDQTFLYYVF